MLSGRNGLRRRRSPCGHQAVGAPLILNGYTGSSDGVTVPPERPRDDFISVVSECSGYNVQLNHGTSRPMKHMHSGWEKTPARSMG